MNKVDTILAEATAALATIEEFGAVLGPAVPAYAGLADGILRVISAGIKAHEAVTGQPLDLTQLHHIDPIDDSGNGTPTP